MSEERSVRRVHKHLVEERDGAVAVVRVEREEALGALSRSMLEALGLYLSELRGDASVRSLVVTGTGRGFITGADINEYNGVSREQFEAYQRLGREVFSSLASLPQPVVAAVNGYAFGGGFELVLSCDVVFAATTASFALPEVKLGLIPGGAGTQRLVRAVGPRATKDLVMTGRRIRAAEAQQMGLVQQVVEPDQLLAASVKYAAGLAEMAPLAVQAAKRVIDATEEASLALGWTLEQLELSRLFLTEDAREGISAFLEKRQATWRRA